MCMCVCTSITEASTACLLLAGRDSAARMKLNLLCGISQSATSLARERTLLICSLRRDAVEGETSFRSFVTRRLRLCLCLWLRLVSLCRDCAKCFVISAAQTTATTTATSAKTTAVAGNRCASFPDAFHFIRKFRCCTALLSVCMRVCVCELFWNGRHMPHTAHGLRVCVEIANAAKWCAKRTASLD